MKTISVLFVLNISIPLLGLAGAFTNLDFERVRQPVTIVGGTPASEAFSGWTALLGGVPQTHVLYNTITVGAGSVDLFSTFPPRAGTENSGGQVISGRYTAGLQGGALGEAALAQTGTIPTGSQALLFNSDGAGMKVSLNGSLAPLVNLGRTGSPGLFSGHDIFGVDISELAGKEVALQFSVSPPFGYVRLDDIGFSSVALVPEPATWALAAVGGALLWAWRRGRPM